MKEKFKRDEQKSTEFEEQVIKPVFPNAYINSKRFNGGRPNEVSTSFQGQLSNKNLFAETPYEYKGDGLFLHFTSFSILSTILNSGFLRMSEFNCLNDKTELFFATSNVFNSPYNDLNKLEGDKSNLFCLSACQSSLETITDEFMWNEYAADGKGCAIEYKFSVNPAYKYLLGKVQYGECKLKPLKDVHDLASQLKAKNNYCIESLPTFLTKISAFHKEERFNRENEVRLLFQLESSFGKIELPPNHYVDFYKDNTLKNFIKLYLKGNHEYVKNDDEDMLGVFPQIEITKIVFGPQVSDSNSLEIHEHLSKIKMYQQRDFEIWEVTKEKEFRKINIEYKFH